MTDHCSSGVQGCFQIDLVWNFTPQSLSEAVLRATKVFSGEAAFSFNSRLQPERRLQTETALPGNAPGQVKTPGSEHKPLVPAAAFRTPQRQEAGLC